MASTATNDEVLTESKASARLGRRVEGLISQVNKAIDAIKVDDIPMEEMLVTTFSGTEFLQSSGTGCYPSCIGSGHGSSP